MRLNVKYFTLGIVFRLQFPRLHKFDHPTSTDYRSKGPNLSVTLRDRRINEIGRDDDNKSHGLLSWRTRD